MKEVKGEEEVREEVKPEREVLEHEDDAKEDSVSFVLLISALSRISHFHKPSHTLEILEVSNQHQSSQKDLSIVWMSHLEYSRSQIAMKRSQPEHSQL